MVGGCYPQGRVLPPGLPRFAAFCGYRRFQWNRRHRRGGRPFAVPPVEAREAVVTQQAYDDALGTRIGQTAMLLHGGDREEARQRFGALWAEIGESGAALHRCTLARYLADAQDDPGDTLAWDLRALAAAESAPADPAEPAGRELRALRPVLHLDLAADYLRLDHPEVARLHLDRARAALGALGDPADDDYAPGVRRALDRLTRRLDPDGGPSRGS